MPFEYLPEEVAFYALLYQSVELGGGHNKTKQQKIQISMIFRKAKIFYEEIQVLCIVTPEDQLMEILIQAKP